MIVVILVLVMAIGGLIMVITTMSKNAGSGGTGEIPPEELELLMLAEVVTSNLEIGQDNIAHIVRAALTFEIHNKDDSYDTFIENFNNKQVIIRDEIIKILRRTTYETLTQAGAQEQLSNEIKDTINALFDTQIIQKVYFAELFVQ